MTKIIYYKASLNGVESSVLFGLWYNGTNYIMDLNDHEISIEREVVPHQWYKVIIKKSDGHLLPYLRLLLNKLRKQTICAMLKYGLKMIWWSNIVIPA